MVFRSMAAWAIAILLCFMYSMIDRMFRHGIGFIQEMRSIGTTLTDVLISALAFPILPILVTMLLCLMFPMLERKGYYSIILACMMTLVYTSVFLIAIWFTWDLLLYPLLGFVIGLLSGTLSKYLLEHFGPFRVQKKLK